MYDLTVTAAELHEIASDDHHWAHGYLWNDGATTWGIKELSSSIGDEAIEDGGEYSTLSLIPDDLSESGREAFMSGFIASVPDEYDLSADLETEEHWANPWEWDKYRDYFDAHLTPQEMGVKWAKTMIADR